MDVCLYFSPLVSTTVDILFSFFPSLFFSFFFFPSLVVVVVVVVGGRRWLGMRMGRCGGPGVRGGVLACGGPATITHLGPLSISPVSPHTFGSSHPLLPHSPHSSPFLQPSLPLFSPTSLLSFPLLSSPPPPPCASQSHHNSSLFGTSLGLNEKIPLSPSLCLRYFQTLQ